MSESKKAGADAAVQGCLCIFCTLDRERKFTAMEKAVEELQATNARLEANANAALATAFERGRELANLKAKLAAAAEHVGRVQREAGDAIEEARYMRRERDDFRSRLEAIRRAQVTLAGALAF